MAHANARLNPNGRALLIRRVLDQGWSAAAAAESMGISRATAYKWVARFETEGDDGLKDRSSRPHRMPRRVPAKVERRIERLRRNKKLGPHRIATRVGRSPSTCYAVLRRQHLNRLSWLDRPTGRTIRRYEKDKPGDLGHMDTKKLARIPNGGGHRILGREKAPLHGGAGYEYVHSLVDDHSRLAYSEIHADEKAETCAAFLTHAAVFFAQHGIHFKKLMTDNAKMYRESHVFRQETERLGIQQTFTKSRCPQTNGKVERFNRTFLEEWAYVRLYRSNAERRRLLPAWIHRYNYHRSHTACGGRPPISRVNNVSGNYS